MDFSTKDLYKLIPDILSLYDDARLKEEDLERVLQCYGKYTSIYPNETLQQAMKLVLKQLLEDGVIAIGTTVKEIGKNNSYNSDLKQWIAVNNPCVDFDCIKSVIEMKSYLGNIKNSLSGKKRLYKYTNIDKISELLRTKKWLVGHPYHLNDKFEYNKFNNWNGKYLSSFMREDNETIAMWSMYGQPWTQGVRVGISVPSFKKWIRGINKIYDDNGFEIKKKFRIHYGDVLYADDKHKEPLKHRKMKNNSFNAYDPEMIGYVKDVAWAYEKEVRLHIDVEGMHQEKVFVVMPDEVISDLEIVLSPRFDEAVLNHHNMELKKITVRKSKFDKLISWVYCDECKQI